ncbi:MAG: DUF6514 family protein [Defluviitaleaceae bacterium]|nr:DUF6514 family protein [Defluviitaleaceae bacterium]
MVANAQKNEMVSNEKISTETGETWILSYIVQTYLNDDGDEYYALRVEKRTPSDASEANASRAPDGMPQESAPGAHWTPGTCVGGDAFPRSREQFPDPQESEETHGITDDRDVIFAMARAFAAGTVTPITLLEMADDWMDSR